MTKSLPTVKTPISEVTLPSNGKKIKIRPFLASEEKILLMAMESGKDSEIKLALTQIISNCIVTQDIDVLELANIDIEKIFIEMRKKSVSETIEMKIDLRELFDCGIDECPETKKVSIDLSKLEIKNLRKEKKVIRLDDNICVTLRHPGIGSGNIEAASKTEAMFYLIADIVDEIFEGEDTVHSHKDYDKETLRNWVENSFQHSNLEEAIEFIAEQPYYYKTFDVTCSVCGKTLSKEAKGLIDFFI